MMQRMTMIPVETTAGYRAGACNIGPAEIGRRRRSAIASAIATLAIALALVVLGAPHLSRLVVAPFAVGTAVAWLQVTRRFCVAFGAIGVQNFGALGGRSRIADDAARSADRRKALEMIAEAAAIGVAATLSFVLLPL